MIKISIITVNYNGYADTCELIDSVAKHLSSPYELIVVDNGSFEDQASMFAALYPHIKTVRSDVNLGFAGGNNLGLQYATTDYILLINNDALLVDDSICYLVDRLSDPRVGAVSPKIKFSFEPNHIQFAGYTPLSAITLRNALIGFDCEDAPMYNLPTLTPYIHGAAVMFRRDVLDRAGAMPELYFLYYEELDWSERIKEAGYELWYEPRSTVLHKESRSTGQDSPLKVFYLTRNRMLFAWRNCSLSSALFSLIYQMVVAAPKRTLQLLLHGQCSQAWAVWRGIFIYFKIHNKRG